MHLVVGTLAVHPGGLTSQRKVSRPCLLGLLQLPLLPAPHPHSVPLGLREFLGRTALPVFTFFPPKVATCLFPGIGPNLSKCPQTPILCWACRREVQICASLLVSPTRTLTMDSVAFPLLGVPDIHTGGEALASSRTHSGLFLGKGLSPAQDAEGGPRP